MVKYPSIDSNNFQSKIFVKCTDKTGNVSTTSIFDGTMFKLSSYTKILRKQLFIFYSYDKCIY